MRPSAGRTLHATTCLGRDAQAIACTGCFGLALGLRLQLVAESQARAPMPRLHILILSDGRPGHFHLSDGVAAAIGRRVVPSITRQDIGRRRIAPARLLADSLRLGLPPALVLAIGYGLNAGDLPRADLVISAGGDTLAANVASARLLGASNIFCGSLRHFPPEAFGLVVSSYDRHRRLPRHLVTLKPNGIDPDTLPRRPPIGHLGPGQPPRVGGLLVGGPSGLFRWRNDEWQRLSDFISESHARHGTSWIVSTSRRTPDHVADAFKALSRRSGGPILELIDFRLAGPGTLPRLFGLVDAVLATEDSSTMMSEAVCARLPLVGVSPAEHSFKDEEREYRALMVTEGWCRCLPLARLSPDRFVEALGGVQPLVANHLDQLAVALEERLPELFRRN